MKQKKVRAEDVLIPVLGELLKSYEESKTPKEDEENEMSKEEIDGLLNALAAEKRKAYEEAARFTGKSVEELMESEKQMSPERKKAFNFIYDVTGCYGHLASEFLDRFLDFKKERDLDCVVCDGRPEVDAMVLFTYISASIARELGKEFSRLPDGSEEDGFDSFMSMARDLYIFASAIDSAVDRAKLLKEAEGRFDNNEEKE